jgi:carnitine O-acetyltransferase
MADPSLKAEDKLKALRKASAAHSQYTADCMQGQGVDRHLLGMRLCLQQGESCPVLIDPLSQRATYFQLSTSGLSSGDYYNGTGFGAVVPDGYGINYCIGKQAIKLGIESKKFVRSTSSSAFRQHLTDALLEMRSLCMAVNSKM